MRKACIYFLVLIFSILAYGGYNGKQNVLRQTPIDTHRLKKEGLASQLLDLLGLQESFEEHFQMFDSLIRESIENEMKDNNIQMENLDELIQQLRQVYFNEFRWIYFKKDYVKIYADAYDEQELLELIEFYNSPLGRKAIEKQQYVTKSINARIIEKQKKLMLKTDKVIEDFALSSALKKTNKPRLTGDYYYGRGEFEKAIIEYSKAIEKNPNDHISLNNLAWLLATCPEEKYRDRKRALSLAQKAVNINPEFHILDTLAKAYAVNGDLKNAIIILEGIIETGIENNINEKKLLYYRDHLSELKEKDATIVDQ